jgi:hypothetical protein
MQDKAQLMRVFDWAHEKMRAVLPGIDCCMEIYPNWTIKEMLAHLVGWDDATAMTLRAFGAGQPTSRLAVRGIDAYNAQIVAERADLQYEQIVREWELVREQLKAILNDLPAERLGDMIVSPWGPVMTVARLVAIIAYHEVEHAVVVQELRKANHIQGETRT